MAKTIFVGNLPWSTSESELQTIFSQFGNVISARIVTDKFSGRSRGFGFVDMDDEAADKAIQGMAGYKLNDREITVNEAKPKSSDGGGRRDSRSGGGRGYNRM